MDDDAEDEEDDDNDDDDDGENGEDGEEDDDDDMMMIIGRIIIIIWKLKCKMIIEKRMNLIILRRIIEHSIDNDDNIYYLCYFEIYWKIILDWVNFEFVYWVGNLL